MASSNDVGQLNVKPKTVKISGRVSAETAGARPPGLSWGVWIDQLAARRPGRSRRLALDVDLERLRHVTWAAVALDRIAKSVGAMTSPVSGGQKPEEVLAFQTATLAELAEIRRQLECVTGDVAEAEDFDGGGAGMEEGTA